MSKCIQLDFGKKWDNTAKSYIFDIDMCILLYEKKNFLGKKELVCNRRNLTILEGNVKSLRKLKIDTKVFLYTESDFKGESRLFSDFKVEDLGSYKFKSVKLENIPDDDCVLISDEPNFDGKLRILCDEINELKAEWDNNIDSIKVGKSVKKVALLDHSNENSKYFILNGGEEIRDIKKKFPELSDNISTIYLHVENCVIFFTESNYKGESQMFCRSQNLGNVFKNKIKSIQVDFLPGSDYLVYLYSKEGQSGKKITINNDVADTSSLPISNFGSFLLVDTKIGVL